MHFQQISRCLPPFFRVITGLRKSTLFDNSGSMATIPPYYIHLKMEEVKENEGFERNRDAVC